MLTMPEPAPVALFGDLLATQAQGARRRGRARRRRRARHRGARRAWACRCGRAGSARAARRRTSSASSTCRCASAAQEIRPGDLVVLDADGVTVVAAERADEVLQASRAREEKEAVKREQARGRRALLRARRAARDRGGRDERHRPPRAGRAAHARRARRACASSSTSWAWRSSTQDGAVDLPARLGRLPAAGRSSSPSPTTSGMGVLGLRACEPGGARAARRRGRGGRARRGLGRRRPRPRRVLPLPRPRRPPLRALLRVRALRAARRTCGPR